MRTRSFRALIPPTELSADFASPPYDVLNTTEAREIIGKQPNSFLRVVRSEATLVDGIDPYSPEVYEQARKNFIRMQEVNNCFFFIADYHSLTTHPDASLLKKNVRQVLAEYLACGLDPEKSTIYVQSDIPETAELYLLLNMHAYLGELERATTFKEKARKQPDNINAGLLTYPVLMAADILIHKAAKVPVGKDQEQHLEMTRQFGNRFNRMYNVDYFPEPVAYNFGEQLVKIPGLDGTGKMGWPMDDSRWLGRYWLEPR